MISLFLFESDVYWKIWGIKMFNQCFLEYFPSFRVMLWACDCPAPGEFVHECVIAGVRAGTMVLSVLCRYPMCFLREPDISYQETLFTIAYNSAKLCSCLG